MRKPLRPGNGRNVISRQHTIPASTKGWVANEAISMMDPQAAVVLDNFFPDPDGLRWRPGSQVFATTPETTPVETIMVWQGGSSTKMFACVGNKIYDVTNGGNVASAAVSGLSNNRWQWLEFSTPGGQFLVAVNGFDAPRFYDGTSWSTSPAITGPANPNALVHVWASKRRLWFIESGTADAWYLAPNSIGGAATKFPLGSLMVKGGSLISGCTWTHDAGQGPQDYCVFLSSEGEVFVYAGTDPASSTTWSIVARFVVGRPIGRRCTLNIGADVVLLCSDGLMPGSQAINIDRAAAARAAFTWNIQKAFTDAYALYGQNFGWQILSYAKGNMAIINIPTAEGVTSIQYVMNVLTGAWCRYLGLNASSWGIRRDDLFFGDVAGKVFQAEIGSADNNTAIAATWISAFNDLGIKGRTKSARMARPVFITDPGIAAQVAVCVDYNIVAPTAAQSSPVLSGSLWGSARWGTARWAAQNNTMAKWVAVTGEGYQMAAAVSIKALPATPNVGVNCKITEMNVLYEPGGYF